MQRTISTRPISHADLVRVAAQMFAAKGVRATTLDEVAAVFGVTKPALYYYVRSKHDILWAIFDHILNMYEETARRIAAEDIPPAEKFQRLVASHAAEVIQHKDYATIFFREQAQLSARERRQLADRIRDYDRVFENCYLEGVRAGVFRDLDVHAIVSGVVGIANWLHQWYDPKGRIKPEEITRLYTDLLEHGYLAEPARE